MTRFRSDNTEGYAAEELAELNAAWEQIASAAPVDDYEDSKSMLDHWAECLLAEYDRGKRGADLTAWFYDNSNSAHESP